jgi:hypothetical protein
MALSSCWRVLNKFITVNRTIKRNFSKNKESKNVFDGSTAARCNIRDSRGSCEAEGSAPRGQTNGRVKDGRHVEFCLFDSSSRSMLRTAGLRSVSEEFMILLSA